MTTKFKTGKTYWMRSIGDFNCIWNVKVIKRTAKTVLIKVDGERENKTCRIRIYENIEKISPLGTYSMNPVLSANYIRTNLKHAGLYVRKAKGEK